MHDDADPSPKEASFPTGDDAPQPEATASEDDAPDDGDAPDRLDFPVVGIGASAGGLGAFQTFLEHLPEEPGMAFVLVQHLDPDRESDLPSLLQNATAMQVAQVENHGGMALEANRIYVIPPGRDMTIDGGKLHLSEMTAPRVERAPIDLFFRSLAASQDGNAVGVVLSGTGTGGTTGLKRIKETGGVTLVQDPDEAEFEGMPRSAVQMGMVDVVAPAAELAERLVQYRDALSRIQLPEDGEALEEEDEEVLQSLFALVRARTGHDFSDYKRSTMLRRIRRRMQVHHIEELSRYRDHLREHDEEAQALTEDLLISVTHFFRDADAFAALREEVIPELFKDKGGDDTVRVWTTGCATGEEAYSMAILLHEHAAALDGPIPEIQVFATDLGKDAIQTAREGFYSKNIAADLSEERLNRFFEKRSNGYRVRRDLRESVIFAEHDLMSDPPFSRLDLVVCRNLLIYLQREAQRSVFDVMHYALRSGGYLFLGSAESADEVDDLFRPVNKEHRIYRCRDDAEQAPRVGEMPFVQHGSQEHTEPQTTGTPPESRDGPPAFEDVRAALLEDYAPPGVVVDAQDDIVHVFKGAHRYLRVSHGAPTHDVLETIRPELRAALRSALFQVQNEQTEIRSHAVEIEIGGRRRRVRAVVRPMDDAPFRQVIFERMDEEGDERGAVSEDGAEDPLEEQQRMARRDAEAHDAEVDQLETELKETRRELRATVEEYETSMEELRASNEELQSMNEELRSTTEELETSREELRSTNEELHTVNQELNNKNEELARVNSDLHNLLRSTEIATVFLDRNLRIQRFTPRAEDLFNIIESDRGRPLAHVTQRFDHEGLLDDVRRVLDRLTPVEREVQNEEGRYFLAQIHPYRTAREDKIDGVVLTFVDITERREVKKELRRSEERHRLLLKGVEEYAIIMLDPEGRVATWNAGAEAIIGYTEDEIVGSTGAILYTEKDREAGLFEKKLEEARAEGQAAHDHWLTRRNGSRFWGTGVITALHDPGGSLRGFAKVMRDNTARRERVQELRRREERFRTLSEAMPDVAWETDADGQFTYINQRLTEFTGRPAEVFYGNTADPLFHPEEREAVLDAWQEALDTGETFQIEHRIQREDGAYRWFLTRALPVRDEETGRITRWLGTSTEIHERKEAQGELRRLNETLEERVEERTAQVRRLVSQLVQAEERERRRIAQILHDDVQQQIYGAEMTARRARRLLESGDLGEEAAEQFTDVCNQMDAILEEAIETTRTLSAELSPSVLREEDLGDILRWLAEHMQQRHGLTVETDVNEASAVPDDDLRALLFRVVRELLFNIVKHANVDHAHLDVRTEDGELLVQIRDDGAGFDPETLAGDGPSGYGLSEMRERLRLLGGRLDIKSAPGEGTRAIVAVPAPGGVGA